MQRCLRDAGEPLGFYIRGELNENLAGNEVYHTACSLLVISKNSCRQLDCHKGFNSILFSYKIRGRRRPCLQTYLLFGIRDPGFGIRDSGFGIRDLRSGIRDSEFGIQDSGFGNRDSGFVL